MLKSLFGFLFVLMDLLRVLVLRRVAPDRWQRKEDIQNEIENIQQNIEKLRSHGDDAAADALLRRLRERIQVESIHYDDASGKRGGSDIAPRQ